MAWLNAIVTVLSMLVFGGIVLWAFSKGRAQANHEAAMLPFELPEEFKEPPSESQRPLSTGSVQNFLHHGANHE